jgi:uncharacterized protein YqeY
MLIRKKVEHHANEEFDDDYSNHDRAFRSSSRSSRDDQERSQHQLKSIRQRKDSVEIFAKSTREIRLHVVRNEREDFSKMRRDVEIFERFLHQLSLQL